MSHTPAHHELKVFADLRQAEVVLDENVIEADWR